MTSERESLEDAVRGSKRQGLEAMRDYIAHQLEANLCNTCLNSRLRTGDQASLLLRLSKVLEELEAIPVGEEGTVSRYDELLARRNANRESGTASPSPTAKGTKSAERRQGGRRTRGDGGAKP